MKMTTDTLQSSLREGWRLVSLGEVTRRTQYGLSLSSDPEGTVPIMKMGNIVNGKIDASDRSYVSLSEEELDKYRLEKGDLLFNRTNSFDLVGKTALFDLDEDWVCASYIVRIQLDTDKADPTFIAAYFNTPIAQHILSTLATKGVSQSNINPTMLKKHLLIPLPPLPEQKRIATILSTWDRAIELTDRLIEACERRKRGLMEGLLGGRFARKDDIVHWKRVSLEDICDINPPKPEGMDDDAIVSFITMSDVSESAELESMVNKKYSDVSKGYTTFQEGDVLVAKITPCFENGKGARAEGLTNGVGFGSTEFHVLRAKDDVGPQFIHYHTNTQRFRGIGKSRMTGSAGQKRVPKSFLQSYSIHLPPVDEQKLIVEILSHCDKELRSLQRKTTALKMEKKGLTQSLLYM